MPANRLATLNRRRAGAPLSLCDASLSEGERLPTSAPFVAKPLFELPHPGIQCFEDLSNVIISVFVVVSIGEIAYEPKTVQRLCNATFS
jgi:hypothetical protein